MAQRDLSSNGPRPAENVVDERDDLPMPRTPASGSKQSRDKKQRPHADDQLATTPPSEHVEPGTKPERNTM